MVKLLTSNFLMTSNLSFNDLFTEKGMLNKKTMLLVNQNVLGYSKICTCNTKLE